MVKYVSDVLYLDFSKAFDKVDHEILLRKVWNIGIRGKLFDWIADFLRDRTQTVQVDGFLSFWDSVLSSVPQGTVLGPLLFIIYVNDLEQTVRDALIGCFADDTRLTKAIRGESIEADMFLLQVDLHRVIRWALENNMELNESKFDLLCYSFRPAAALFRSLPFTQSLFEYETPSGTRIQSTNSVRDLGVNMSPDYTCRQSCCGRQEDPVMGA
jgi:ribonucleases P/MRP protein subunit RPP40